MSKFLGYLWAMCFLSAIVTGALGMELIAFVFGTVLIVTFLIHGIVVSSAKWHKYRKEPLQNDPCGNSNINKKPWDYM